MALSLIETKDLSVVEMNAEQAHKNVFLSETHTRLLAQLAKSLKTRVLNPVSFELTSLIIVSLYCV